MSITPEEAVSPGAYADALAKIEELEAEVAKLRPESILNEIRLRWGGVGLHEDCNDKIRQLERECFDATEVMVRLMRERNEARAEAAMRLEQCHALERFGAEALAEVAHAGGVERLRERLLAITHARPARTRRGS